MPILTPRQSNFQQLFDVPASGTLPSIVMPANRRGYIVAVWFSITLSATVANREFQITLVDDAAASIFTVGNGQVLTAGTNEQWWYGENWTQVSDAVTLGASTHRNQGLGCRWHLEAGWRINISAINFQANDTLALRALAALDVA